MTRYNLLTKEKAKQAAEGKLKTNFLWEIMKDQLMMIWRDSLSIFKIRRK